MRIDGSEVRQRRMAAGLSARALARVAGLTAPVVARLEETGKADHLTLGAFSRLCDALGAAPNMLLSGGGGGDGARLESSLVGELLRALVGGDGQVEVTALVEHLGVPADRILSAVLELREQLAPYDLFVTVTEGRIALGSRSGVTAVPDTTERKARNRRRLDARTAGFVRSALAGRELDYAVLAGDAYIRVQQLRNAEIFREGGGEEATTVSHDAVYSILDPGSKGCDDESELS